MPWSTSFQRQARSDLATLQRLASSGVDKCQVLHYLQMAGEKLAKSFSPEATANQSPPHTHFGLSRWITATNFSNEQLRNLGFKSQRDFKLARASLVAIARAVEQCNPKLANDRANGVSAPIWTGVAVNVEYPWQSGTDVIAPCEYLFDEEALQETRLMRLARLLDRVCAAELQLPVLFG
jgi:hypothetical protein